MSSWTGDSSSPEFVDLVAICRPKRVEIDAHDVINQYARILQVPGSGIRDEGDLPYPKEVIKFVLLEILRRLPSGEDGTPLRMAYLALADFQDLSYRVESALKAVIAPTGASDGALREVAKRIADSGEGWSEAFDKMKKETAQLEADLRRLKV